MDPFTQTVKRACFGILGAAVVTSVVAAQTPDPQQTRPQTSTAAEARVGTVADDEQSITVIGCLKEEAEVPGFEPNVAERAGIMEDFILTEARVSTSSGATARSSTGASATESSAAATSSADGPDADQTPGDPSRRTDSPQGQSGYGQNATSGNSADAGDAGDAEQPTTSTMNRDQDTASMGAMYKVEGIDDDELRQHANHQVEIRGKVEADELGGSAAGADPSQRDSDDLPEIEAESIRMIAAACPAN